MPPKRRVPAPSSTAPPKQPRRSALAKAHSISASTEAEIREAFLLFSTSETPSTTPHLPSSSLRRALTALGVSPSSRAELAELLSTVDPDDSGVVDYETFVAVAALKLNARSEGGRKEEVEDAFGLFVGRRWTGVDGDGEREERITMGDLRRVARELKEDVSEGVLRDMIAEANGGEGAQRGVGVGEFEAVMRRAGVFG